MSKQPRVVVVGTGRSGSGYISAVLTAAGLRCGHEGWWNPLGVHQSGILADSSWCAVPDLPRIFDGAIGHQVRDPLRVVTSLVSVPDHGPYIECRERIIGTLPADYLDRAILTYVAWNEACEALTQHRWRVEDVDAELVADLVRGGGVECSTERAQAAIDSVSTTYNDHGPHELLTWGDLPVNPRSSALFDMAEKYGYV